MGKRLIQPRRWWVLAGAFLYVILPTDLVPDFIPVVGWLDDIAVVAAAVVVAARELRSTLHAIGAATHFLQRKPDLT